MMPATMTIGGIALLAAGTWLMRFAGYKLGSRLALSERTRMLLSDAAIVLLLAVAATATLFNGQAFAGYARLAGVLVALFLAWRKVPLILVIISAGLVTALMRYVGVM
ncbi:branched-chain amino acid transport [Pantoea alhagi]|uniref:Branched-chain amino acid transport n=2 Tax=Pantoea alhagi TaxID=1891675 RepID=A0A1W6BA66_9GAMM|nr:branched-chain amino acid transport [Pantoea alhagi]